MLTDPIIATLIDGLLVGFVIGWLLAIFVFVIVLRMWDRWRREKRGER